MNKLVARQVRVTGLADGASIRSAQFRGRDHLVVPVVALVGDVVVRGLNSAGPEFVPAAELAYAPAGWDGRPVVSNHPGDGMASANAPNTLEAESFGQVFNTRFEEGRLRMDAWLDVGRARELGGDPERVVERVLAGEMVEVSVGAWVSPEKRPGIHAGLTYEYVWSGIVPDHLAMLPEGTLGACSNEMGCGAPRAARAHEGDEMEKTEAHGLRSLLERALKALGGGDDDSEPKSPISANAESDETNEPETKPPAVARAACGASCDCGCQNSGDITAHSKEDIRMSQIKKDLVGRLVANEAAPFGESDAAALEAFSESRLRELNEQFAEKEEPEAVEAAKPAKVEDEDDTVRLSRDEYEEIKEAASAYKAAQAKEKGELVASLAKATDAYDKTELGSMTVPALKKLAKALKVDEPAVDYSLRGIPSANEAVEDEVSFPVPDVWGLSKSRAGKEAN